MGVITLARELPNKSVEDYSKVELAKLEGFALALMNIVRHNLGQELLKKLKPGTLKLKDSALSRSVDGCFVSNGDLVVQSTRVDVAERIACDWRTDARAYFVTLHSVLNTFLRAYDQGLFPHLVVTEP